MTTDIEIRVLKENFYDEFIKYNMKLILIY